jgi:NADH:ubiquinone oxidoreductase subunit C
MSTYNSKVLVNYFIFTNYFNYFTYIFFLNNHSTINSVAAFFKNTVFLERENTEMFNTKFKNMCDTRNLLLDYTNNEKPLLKYFNVEGFHEIYLNVFTNTLELININYIEL